MTAPPVMQKSFHAGEWAPALNARVDLAKYHSAAATMLNFFVDYRGGASTRMGTKYILQTYKTTTTRLIRFQASFTVGYILEFGDLYIRFFNNGSAILEATKAITGASKANPGVITAVAHGYATGDWVYIAGVGGMTQLNGKYYKITKIDNDHFSLQTLNGVNVDTTGYTTYTSGGTSARVYTLTTPYVAADLALLKFAQNVDKLIITHPNYAPRVLTIVSANNWTIGVITFGPTLTAPTGQSASTTLGAGTVNYSYKVTTVDENGQESLPSSAAVIANTEDLRTVAGSNSITWSAVTGASSYNVYKAELRYGSAVPTGVAFGFIGNTQGLTLVDSNIPPDFSSTPQLTTSPFTGSGISGITVTAGGSYTSVPGVTISAPGAGGAQAFAQAIMQATNVTLGGFPGVNYNIGDVVSLPYGIQIIVASIAAFGSIATFNIFTLGSPTDTISGNPVGQVSTSGAGVNAQFTITYTVVTVNVTNPGSNYSGSPTATFSSGAATATPVIGSSAVGNPSVPSFFQQRLVLAAPPGALQTFYMSQPGSYYNFNVSYPIQSDDAIAGAIVSGQLNEIKSLISMPSGLIILSNSAAWLLNGGSPGAPVTPSQIVANANAYNGASDVPPIVSNYDILYVQSKGSIVRDLSYNFYANVFTGTDISVLSSHLFYSYQINEWAWAEEPFKLVWAVRSDGVALSLTFLKEQELIGWARHSTDGLFKSVASVTETIPQGSVDAVYFVVQRSINGNTVQYIERMADRYFSSYTDPWCVDAGLQYNGAAATVFSGLDHLVGETITGLADGSVIPATVVSATGTVTLATAATYVTIGLPFTPQLQTLAVDTGEPTVQGKRKQVSGFTVRCEDTLGLYCGRTFDSDILVPMDDLVLGNLGSVSNAIVTDLVTSDARTIMDPLWDTFGQCCIQQNSPYPATVLGVIPEITVGDTVK